MEEQVWPSSMDQRRQARHAAQHRGDEVDGAQVPVVGVVVGHNLQANTQCEAAAAEAEG